MTPDPTRLESIAVAILAAGAGRRFGRPKATARLGGRSFLTHALQLYAKAGLTNVVVVVRQSWEPEPRTFDLSPSRVIRNASPAGGPISSIRAALLHEAVRDADALLVHPVDHPLVRLETIRAILSAASDPGSVIVIPCHAGRGGHPTLFGSRTFPELQDAGCADGARTVVRRDAGRVRRIEVADRGVTLDVDTPEDLLAAERVLSEREGK